MKRFYFQRLEFLFLLSLFGFILPTSHGAVPLNPSIGSNWSPYRKASSSKGAISRETSVSDAGSKPSPVFSSQAYSTLPQEGGESLRTVNSFGVDPNQNGFMSGSPDQSANYFNYQLVNSGDSGQFQQQQQGQGDQQQFQSFFPGQFPPSGGDFQGGQGFEGFADVNDNGIEESTGLLGLMSNLIERFSIGNIFSRMREMIVNFMERTELSSLFSGVGSFAMSAMALPMMLPMAGLAGLPIAMAFMAFPILQMTIPGIRRSISDTAVLTTDVLKSEECVERFSCNLARVAKKLPYEGWISGKLEKSQNKWLTRVSKSLKAARTGEECSQFTCSPVTRMQKMIKTYFLGEKVEVDEKTP